MNLGEDIPRYIIIRNEVPTNDDARIAATSGQVGGADHADDLDDFVAPPPALERWSSEGSSNGRGECKLHNAIPPVPPTRRTSTMIPIPYHHSSSQNKHFGQALAQVPTPCTCSVTTSNTSISKPSQQLQVQKEEDEQPPRLPCRRSSTVRTQSQGRLLAVDRWN